MTELTEKITGAGTPFDYKPTVYKGAARRLWEAYQTLHVHILFDRPLDVPEIKELKLESKFLPLVAPSATVSLERIGDVDVPRVGYKYINSGDTFFTEPDTKAMDALLAFLSVIYVGPTEDLGSPVRSWWSNISDDAPGGAENRWKRQLQRMIVSCFDDEALVHARTTTTPDGKDVKAFYDLLCKGLIEKTHKFGYAAPQHFDVLMTIVNLYGLEIMDNDLTKVFGPDPKPDPDTRRFWAGTQRLRKYTGKVGQMCCGMVGSFARYATPDGVSRPGRFVRDAKTGVVTQTEDGGGPIPIIATKKGQVVPPRWNLSGMEGSFMFGTDAFGKDTFHDPEGKNASAGISPSKGLTRAGLGGVQPGDIVVFLEVSHVLVIDEVTYDGEETATVSTLESAAEGVVYSRGLTLRRETGVYSDSDFAYITKKEARDKVAARLNGKNKEFSINHLARNSRFVSVRRINHWSLNRPHVGDGTDGSHCGRNCKCYGRHDLSNP